MKLNINPITAEFCGYEGDNIVYSVSFFREYVFMVEAPPSTDAEEVECAVLRSLFSDRVRGEAEAWLSHE